MSHKTNVVTRIVLKIGSEYLEDYYEDWEDEKNNFRTTLSPERAYSFYGDDDIPKYAWNYEEERCFESVNDLCNLLNGKLERVITTTIIEYHTEDFSF